MLRKVLDALFVVTVFSTLQMARPHLSVVIFEPLVKKFLFIPVDYTILFQVCSTVIQCFYAFCCGQPSTRSASMSPCKAMTQSPLHSPCCILHPPAYQLFNGESVPFIPPQLFHLSPPPALWQPLVCCLYLCFYFVGLFV